LHLEESLGLSNPNGANRLWTGSFSMRIAQEVPESSHLRTKRIATAIRLAAILAIAAAALAGHSGAQTVTQLHSFTGGSDGFNPSGNVVADKNGVLYGTAFYGGWLGCNSGVGCGTIYQLTPPADPDGSWTFSTIYEFKGKNDGCCQYSTLAIDSAGNLYGVTNAGLPNGSVFQLSPPAGLRKRWKFSILYTFKNQSDGAYPNTPLVIDKSGAIYGVTPYGSLPGCSGYGCGAVFQLVPPQRPGGKWKENTLYQFQGLNDGGSPNGLVMDKHGTLYGTTFAGGLVTPNCPNGCGNVFEVYPIGNYWYETPIYSFKDTPDGAFPYSLTIDRSGVLYGLAGSYTKQNDAAVFKLTPPARKYGNWHKTVIHAFPNGSNGSYGPSYLAEGDDGNLYGAIFGDIDLDAGYVFRLKPPGPSGGGWTYRTLVDFNVTGPDRNPNGVIRGKVGHLYGTLNGGDSDGGDVFEIN
jgi:hypothetical protein